MRTHLEVREDLRRTEKCLNLMFAYKAHAEDVSPFELMRRCLLKELLELQLGEFNG